VILYYYLGVTSSSSSSSAPSTPAAQTAPIPPKADIPQSAIDLKRDTAKASEQLQAVTELGAAINAAVVKDMALVNQANLIPKEYFDQSFTTKIKGSSLFALFCCHVSHLHAIYVQTRRLLKRNSER